MKTIYFWYYFIKFVELVFQETGKEEIEWIKDTQFYYGNPFERKQEQVKRGRRAIYHDQAWPVGRTRDPRKKGDAAAPSPLAV